MVELEVATGTANVRSEPSADRGEATVIATLRRGDAVRQLDWVKAHPDWVEVEAGGRRGFAKRMLFAQSNPGAFAAPPAALRAAYNDAVWQATEDFDEVSYRLGSKNPKDGRVDCSGWIAFVNRLAFNATNTAAGWQVFSEKTLRLLNTHSDHQVSLPGYRAGQIYNGLAIERLPFRPGLLIGINMRDYDWERGQSRVYEIDHIVQTVASPAGTLWITQSSSSGGGVNRAKLEGWLASMSRLASENRLHVVDIFALAALVRPALETVQPGLELPELDVAETPAG